MPDINCENTIIDNLLIKSKRDRAKYAFASKKRQDFIWHITKDMISEPYEELCGVSSWEEVAEKLSVPPNERGYIVSAFDENIDGTFLNAYKALQKVVFHGVAVIFFPKSNLLYFEGEPEYHKSFRCVKRVQADR